ncbi:hypothetical protein LWS67_23255, partial [Bacillus atrophaeus]|nr:hypothetical protein [Bacillus atrophaeus]
LYHISYIVNRESLKVNDTQQSLLTTHSNQLKLLWECGFRSPEKEKKVVKGIDAVIDYVLEFEQKRDNLPYEIDGMVVKVNSIELQDTLG